MGTSGDPISSAGGIPQISSVVFDGGKKRYALAKSAVTRSRSACKISDVSMFNPQAEANGVICFVDLVKILVVVSDLIQNEHPK